MTIWATDKHSHLLYESDFYRIEEIFSAINTFDDDTCKFEVETYVDYEVHTINGVQALDTLNECVKHIAEC
ncbi:MAG: hypothetical protein KC414_13370, partial [Romboutsia sp.]|nr:hypothetical protein [Romboutsia sp.]